MRIKNILSAMLASATALAFLGEQAMAKENKREIKTYLSFGLPIDPARVYTLVDLDFSYALAATLVDWNDAKEPISGLAESWQYTGEKEITFKLQQNLKWSDGTTLDATDVVKSFERAKRAYPSELKSLFDLVDSIEAKGPGNVVFKLNVPSVESGVIRKLTEPMYGIIAVEKNGDINLKKSSGPYSLESASENEVALALNSHRRKKEAKMAERVTVRQTPKGEELQESFLHDEWVNLLTSSSLAPEALHKKYKAAHYTTWNRSLDKVFFLSPGPRLSNENGRRVTQALNQLMNRKTLTKELGGLTLSDQFFVPGYVLFDPEFKKTLSHATIPDAFKKRPIEILGIESRLHESLRSNLKETIKEALGVDVILKTAPLNEIDKARSRGDYDFFAAALPVNDGNVEGALGYIFGMTPTFIPNAGETGSKNFYARVMGAKKLTDQAERNREYRHVFADAINEGCILPLFHYSTIVIAKQGIDLSSVPASDETVAFAKVRFK